MAGLILRIFGLIVAVNVVLGTHTENVHDFFNEINSKDFHHHMNKFNSTINRICEGYGDRFDKALEEVIACGDTLDDDKLTYCQVVQKGLRNCTKPLTDIFEECLPKGLKNWPSFIIDTTLSVAKYLCETDGEHIIELANPCIKNTNRHTEICARLGQKKFKTHGFDNLPTTHDVCRASVDIKPCFVEHVRASCHDVITQDSFVNLYDELFKPCQH